MTPFKKRCAVIAFACAFLAGVVCGRMAGSTPVAAAPGAAVDYQELPNWEEPMPLREVDWSDKW